MVTLSRKKTLFWICLFLYLVSLIVQVYLNPSIFGIVAALTGIVASVIGLLIPVKFSKEFSIQNWQPYQNGYSLPILRQEHGCGNSPKAQVFLKGEQGFQECGVDINFDHAGNIIVQASHAFDGKIIVN